MAWHNAFICPQGFANPIVRLVDNHHIFLRLVDHSCNDLRVFFYYRKLVGF